MNPRMRIACVFLASLAVATTAACSSSAQPQPTVPTLSTTDPNGYRACTEQAKGFASDSGQVKMNAIELAARAAALSTTPSIRATYVAHPEWNPADLPPSVEPLALKSACEAAGVPMPDIVQGAS